MFGFLRFGDAKTPPAQPAAKSGCVLVSKEDIYREGHGAEPILLIRKGYEVTQDQLPRLIRHGVRPQQFELKQAAVLPETEDPGSESMPYHPTRGRTMPFSPMSVPMTPRGNQVVSRLKKSTLILEPDGKHLKRLIDCLFVCGLSLDRIHTVRTAKHLTWAVGKYQPEILLLAHRTPEGQSGLDLLTALPGAALEKAIVTVAFRTLPSEAEKTQWENRCRQYGAHFLAMPANRHALRKILWL